MAGSPLWARVTAASSPAGLSRVPSSHSARGVLVPMAAFSQGSLLPWFCWHISQSRDTLCPTWVGLGVPLWLALADRQALVVPLWHGAGVGAAHKPLCGYTARGVQRPRAQRLSLRDCSFSGDTAYLAAWLLHSASHPTCQASAHSTCPQSVFAVAYITEDGGPAWENPKSTVGWQPQGRDGQL